MYFAVVIVKKEYFKNKKPNLVFKVLIKVSLTFGKVIVNNPNFPEVFFVGREKGCHGLIF